MSVVTAKIGFWERANGFFNKYFAYFLIAPCLLVLFFVVVYPSLYLIVASFQDINYKRPWETGFIGLENYIEIFSDKTFWRYLGHTCIYVGGAVPTVFLLGLVIALCLNQNIRFKGGFRVIVLLPWIIPHAVTGAIWRWLLHGQFGVFNYFLLKLGIVKQPVSFFGSTTLAMLTLISVDVWYSIGFVVVILLAGLQNIPEELYDSAKVDGSGTWNCFRYVTIPFLKPAILIVLLIRTMFVFRTFSLVYLLTQGGPGESTSMLSIYIYEKSMKDLRMGYTSAVSILMIIMAFGIMLFYSKILRSEVEY